MNQHRFTTHLRWTGNRGRGTADYQVYGRDHIVEIAGKPPLLGSSDASFRGDAARHNPEDLLVSALSACHMLAYLHLCAVNGIVVEAYEDEAGGVMRLDPDGSGRFTEVVLRPRVRISAGAAALAQSLHEQAHRLCFIANSVNFSVLVEPAVNPGVNPD